MVGKRVLVVKLGQIGDVIMAIPGVFALHQQGYEIDWLCGGAVRSLLECYSWIHVIPADDKAIFFGTFLGRIQSVISLWRALVPETYDQCAILYYDTRYRFLTLPVRAKRKRMLSEDSRSTRLLAGRHHTDEYARFLLALNDDYREGSLVPVRPDRLPSSSLDRSTVSKRIGLVPGAAGNLLRKQVQRRTPEALRRWPIEYFAILAERLVERGWEVVLFGGPDETWVREKFQRLPVVDYIGRLSLPQLVRACDACDVVVSNDTGPLHVAGLSDTGLIGIFGPTDPATRIPRRPYSVGIWGGQGFACRPCYDGRDFAPCTFNGCMHQVTPELVLRELDRLLSNRDQGLRTLWRIVVPQAAGTP